MIEKNIRLQPHHARDLLVGRRSDGRRPGYQPPGHGPGESRNGRSGPPGGGGGHHSPPSRPAPAPSRPAPAPAPAPSPSPHRDPAPAPTPNRVSPQQSMAMTGNTSLAGKTQSQAQASVDRDNKPTRNIHSDTGEEEEAYEIVGGVKVPLSMRGVKGIDPREDPERYFETISPLDKVLSKDERDWTIEDKLEIEKWEKDQDWDKVKELADRGHSSDDIQKAMDKGLLMKQDSIRRQGLIERGLAAVMPKTKLESSLLSNLTSKFDPKSMIGNMLKSTVKSAAMKKLGLGWLNPILGIASLFGLPQKAKSMIASRRAPTFDPKKASQLGLYADRQPTGITQQARVGQGTIGDKIVRGEVDLAKLITGGISPELQKLMAKGKSYSETDIIPSKYQGANLAKFAGAKVTDRNEMKQNTQKFVDMYKEGKYDNLQLAIEDADRYNAGEKTNYEKTTGKPLPKIFSEKLQEGVEAYGENVSESQKRQQELLKEIGVAHGGRIDRPLMGRSRDI